MKLLSISIGSWLLGLMTLVCVLPLAQGHWADIKSNTVTSMSMAALVFALAYAPSLFWLRRRIGGVRPVLLFLLASAIVLNLPVFLIEIFAIGRTLAPSEALACMATFLMMGTVFGLGFVWNYYDAAL